MRQGLELFRHLITHVTNPHVSEAEKLMMIASYIANNSQSFADEVAAGIEALEEITEIATKALGKTTQE
ncbi:hypothetical protein [Paenibacillus sp. MMS18-CY102]|uniref:hypothetical protein n=1 Tax=Paenibacillus sp. MMS18-CY102 TaxID=2682849 RepID=UPI001365D84C|nr:hypothetical protein [Paenibacillus sp. MMS18-CY102]MWC26660.1 hypothetical protein [Paenibacillus sp. MMS18-CY102]